MATSPEYTEYILEKLQPIGPISHARFFSGIGISHGPALFAVIIQDVLYFVVDDSTRPKYEDAGLHCFSYDTKKRHVQVRRYFELPEEILNDAEQLVEWARESIDIAIKTKKSKK